MIEHVGRFEWERALHGDSAVTRTRHHVLLALATFADRDGRVTVGMPKLAVATGLSESTVREHLTAARTAGLLHRVSRGHRRWDGTLQASTYLMTLPAQPPASRRLSDDSTASPRAVDGVSQPPAEPISTASWSGLNRQPPGGIHGFPRATHSGELPPVCGQCDARPGDLPAARIVWRSDGRSEPCPRCHPKVITAHAR